MAFYHDIENGDAPVCEGVSTTHALRAATTAKKRGQSDRETDRKLGLINKRPRHHKSLSPRMLTRRRDSDYRDRAELPSREVRLAFDQWQAPNANVDFLEEALRARQRQNARTKAALFATMAYRALSLTLPKAYFSAAGHQRCEQAFVRALAAGERYLRISAHISFIFSSIDEAEFAAALADVTSDLNRLCL
jgi:hypothetical protein